MIEFKNVSVTYPNGVQALKNMSVTINDGEFVIIVGLSGAGKSTMLRCLNNLVKPTAGEVLLDGKSVTKATGKTLQQQRMKVGMIFQDFNLVKRSSVMRNVLAGRLAHLPTWRTMLGLFPKEEINWAYSCLERVSIGEKAYSRADQLSGGQQQRVGIARALAQRPRVILADEPVASLDPPTSHTVMRDLTRINQEDKITTLVNLHFIDMAQEYGQRIIGLRAGEVVYDGPADKVSEKTFEEIYGRTIRPDDLRGASA